jgi:hypothetical protein
MAKIILSYRRADARAMAGRIRDKLAARYGNSAIYMDVDDIPFGTDFRQHIDAALTEADAVVAVIGPKWVGPDRDGKSRIFEETDPVRVEIETALARGVALIPTLVDGADMPKPADLPDSLGNLSFLNAAAVDDGRDFHQHMDRVIRSLDAVVTQSSRQPTFGARLKRCSGWVAAVTTVVVLLAVGTIFQRELRQGWEQTPVGGDRQGIATPAAPPLASPLPTSPLPTASPPASPSPAGTTERGAPDDKPPPPRPRSGDESCAEFRRPIGVELYCASSVLSPQLGISYGVQNSFGDRGAAWVEGRPGQGIGEWVVVEFDGPRLIKAVEIHNGYQKNSDIYYKNSRVRRLRVVFSQGETQTFTLQDKLGPQTISPDRPIKAYWVQFVIDDIYSGNRYTDTALSRLLVATERSP